jgi:hypothetical protein
MTVSVNSHGIARSRNVACFRSRHLCTHSGRASIVRVAGHIYVEDASAASSVISKPAA